MTSDVDPKGRPLTAGEREALSPGLVRALTWVGVEPLIVPRASLLARTASLWRGHLPVLTQKRRIFWPDAGADFSEPGREHEMAVLQHELQHVLDFATGTLTYAGYLCAPRNWTYDYAMTPACCWADFGAEQRARIVENFWWVERGLQPGIHAGHDHYRRIIPWAG